MKKYRVPSFLLALALAAGLAAPTALASEAPADTSPAPVVTPQEPVESAILNEMEVDAAAAILVDADTGTVLYEQNAHAQRYPASITKVMTALLTLEAVDRGELTLETVVTASSALHTGIGEDASTADIQEGEQMRVIDLLYATLLPSANEACNILAEAVSGSVDAFVELMDQRAAELGMEDTHFANSHGYHDPDHYTTAYDISLMCREAMEHETFRTIVSSLNYTLPATNLHEERIIRSTNALVSTWRITGYWYEYATGVKTGYTPEAGYCLASSATKDDRDLIAVVMGCERVPGTTGSEGFTYFSESSRLLEWGFDNFSERTLLDSTYFAGTVPVTLSREADYVGAEAQGTLEAILPNDLDPADFQITPVFDEEELQAPVTRGQVVGHVTVSNGDTVYGSLDLVAVDDVERSELLYRIDQIQRFFSLLWVRVALIAILVLAVILLLRWLLFGRRRRYGSSRTGYRGSRYSGRRRRR